MPAMRVCGPRAGQQTKDLGNELGAEGPKEKCFSSKQTKCLWKCYKATQQVGNLHKLPSNQFS